ncbi:oxidoreductase [Brachybacterium huguangmaarense]|uniref:Oxidoreductase n=1 Tax=Brachybacterium huguangmaarense TaxID=1652028 RepID=A0ABY6G390_9MICO|nr:oxidoreductase [Brachybacterium huguangmaarense]UYG17577.1 oxidoreductase [Brachybacterium huguangmaarense]
MGYTKGLLEREAELGHPVRVGVVGAGQMGAGLIAQICRTPGMTVTAVADIVLDKATEALRNAGTDDVLAAGDDLDAARAGLAAGRAVAITDGLQMPELDIDIVLEVSGVPEIAAQIAYTCIAHGTDVALMTVEADITVGVLLSRMANAGGSVYTVCRGDEPVECLKLVEYAQDLGMKVVCVGKGKNNPNKPHSVPSDNLAEAERKRMNPRMLTEFTDGTKTQLEMTALSNATGFPIEVEGMHGPECNLADLATTLIPRADGGILDGEGPVVEYVTGDVAPGVFAIVKSESDVVTHELDYLKLGTGPYYLFYRPWHIASIEAPLSIGEAILNRRSDFQSHHVTTEVVARAKSDLEPGITLEGMGGDHYYGWAVPAETAREQNLIPIGLLGRCTLKAPKQADEFIGYDDVEVDETRPLVAMRRLQDALVKNGMI